MKGKRGRPKGSKNKTSTPVIENRVTKMQVAASSADEAVTIAHLAIQVMHINNDVKQLADALNRMVETNNGIMKDFYTTLSEFKKSFVGLTTRVEDIEKSTAAKSAMPELEQDDQTTDDDDFGLT